MVEQRVSWGDGTWEENGIRCSVLGACLPSREPIRECRRQGRDNKGRARLLGAKRGREREEERKRGREEERKGAVGCGCRKMREEESKRQKKSVGGTKFHQNNRKNT